MEIEFCKIEKYNQAKYFLFVLLFAVIGGLFLPVNKSFAYGAPEYLPDGPHPRIWLTPSFIAELKNKKATNSPAWIEFKGRSDVYISYIASSANGELDWPGRAGYAGSGYQDALMMWGMMYYIYKTPAYGTIDETADDVIARGYAQKAITMLNTMIASFSGGEEEDGIDLIRINDRRYGFNTDEHTLRSTLNTDPNQYYRLLTYKNGYASRSTGTVLPIAFDWFYNDPLLTDELKTKLYKIMFRHIDWVRGIRSQYNNGVLLQGIRYHEDKDGDCTGINNCNINDTNDHLIRRQRGYGFGVIGSNFNESHSAMTTLIPLAVYGFAPQEDTDAYLAYGKSLITERLEATTNPAKYKGGDSPEGIAYLSDWHSMLGAFMAVQNATGMPIFEGYEFPKEMARNAYQNAFSSLHEYIHRGSASSSNFANWFKPNAQPYNMLTHILRNYCGEPIEGQRLQRYLTYGGVAPGQVGLAWMRFMWRDDEHALQADVSGDPLFYRAEGTGVVTLRSSWDAIMQPVLVQLSIKGNQRQDHESYDNGNILLSRGSDRLLSRLKKTDGTDEENAIGQNNLVFNNMNSHTSMNAQINQISELTSPAIDREEHSAGYDYISGEMSNAWGAESSTPRAKYFRQSVLFLRPNIVVEYNVARSHSPAGNVKAKYYQLEAAPTIDAINQNITAVVGNSKLLVKTLYPSGGSYIDTDISSQSHTVIATVFHRVKYSPLVTQEYDQFLNVIEATASTDSQTPATLIDGTGGRGTLIEDPQENIIAMFTKNQDGEDITNLSYSADTSIQSKHIIADLTPGENYEVRIDSGTPTQHTASDAGLIEFANATSGSHTYLVTLSSGDQIVPILSLPSSIATTKDLTPVFAFTSTEDGTITYGGSCSSSETSATTGENTIILNNLNIGTYSDCTLTVTDSSLSASTPLAIPMFHITYPGDIDLDKDVDIFDYSTFLGNFGGIAPGDPDDNSIWDIFDYSLLLEDFGEEF